MRASPTPIRRLLLGLALCLPFAAAAQGQGTITVTGEATVQVAPDMATIMLGVTTDGASATAAMDANKAAVGAVIDRLTAAGIEKGDLQTSNLSVNPNWVGYDGGSMPTIAGYSAMNFLNLRVRDLAQLGALVDAAISDGANTLNGISFDLSEPRPALDEARKQAMADAKARAELLAAAAGKKLGGVVAISEAVSQADPSQMMRASASDSAALPIASGQIGMGAAVTVTYELED